MSMKPHQAVRNSNVITITATTITSASQAASFDLNKLAINIEIKISVKFNVFDGDFKDFI